MSGMRNTHLSYSRLSRFESCPLSYQLHYLDKHTAEPGVPLSFGKALHAVLERLLQDVLDSESAGPLSEERALQLYREAWAAEGLSGLDLFQQGLSLLQDFVRQQGRVDARDILAVEKEFRLPVGPFTILGFIDRVDWVDDETIHVIDYKSNHQLFTREELDTSLQLSLYALAARRMWPWAKKVRLSMWMLRHGVLQETTRTEAQLDAALAYVETLGQQMETAESFPARLNPNCVYCDHRRHCPAYARALTGQREVVCEDTSNLESVAREREEVAHLAKILGARKTELESVLRAHLAEQEELVLAGTRYRMFHATSLDYPLEPTVAVLARATGLSREELMQRLASVDKKALDALLKDEGKRLGTARVALLKAELNSLAAKHHSPRFWAKEVA
ncbi:PD-(D/E)XK nuclease family protein [Myxococcus sp. K15C18031901]|uniref:RecB family exonuclease n=1 Tax=Myxococcus dinghuensis TaxID=2906761 RepID=UPI0020A6E76C|nr:PD-(D/E)XK nuclease family protein [Myxococcus dinghuensis]MCP3104215.1 PD-(D/E)XK nuclease family protein [Myxococcus dinghuensis]